MASERLELIPFKYNGVEFKASSDGESINITAYKSSEAEVTASSTVYQGETVLNRYFQSRVILTGISHCSIWDGLQAIVKHTEYHREVLPTDSIASTAPDLDRHCAEWLKNNRKLDE